MGFLNGISGETFDLRTLNCLVINDKEFGSLM